MLLVGQAAKSIARVSQTVWQREDTRRAVAISRPSRGLGRFAAVHRRRRTSFDLRIRPRTSGQSQLPRCKVRRVDRCASLYDS